MTAPLTALWGYSEAAIAGRGFGGPARVLTGGSWKPDKQRQWQDIGSSLLHPEWALLLDEKANANPPSPCPQPGAEQLRQALVSLVMVSRSLSSTEEGQ